MIALKAAEVTLVAELVSKTLENTADVFIGDRLCHLADGQEKTQAAPSFQLKNKQWAAS